MKYLSFFAFSVFCFGLNVQIAVETVKMNTVYAGLETPLTIIVNDLPPERLAVRASTGELQRLDSIHFNWKICEWKSPTAFLVLSDALDSLPFDTGFYHLKRVPEPELITTLRGFHGLMPLNPTGVLLSYHGFDPAPKCEVIQYTVEIFKRNGQILQFSNNGALYQPALKNELGQLAPGEYVWFSRLRFRCGCDPNIRQSHLDQVYVAK